MKYLFFFFAAIVLSYSVDLAPRYVSLLSDGHLTIDGTLERFRTPCNRAPEGDMTCVDSYRIPRSAFSARTESPLGVGLGILISSTEVHCSNVDSHRVRFGDPSSASRALELLKTYETVNLTELSCKGDLIVDVWNPSTYRRSGFIGGSLVIGDANYVQQVKRVVEFCTSDFYLLLGFALWATFLITGLVLKPLTSRLGPDSFFGAFSMAWVIFALTKSGIPEILVPVVSTKLVYIRFANFFSSVAHLGPCVLAVAQLTLLPRLRKFASWLTRPVRRNGRILHLHLVVGAICLSPFFAKWLGLMTLIAFGVSLCVGIRARLPQFTLFSVCALLEAGKLFNVPSMPYGSTTLTFAALLLFDQLVAQIRHGSNISDLLNWARSSSSIKADKRVESLLMEFGDRFKVSQLTVIEPKKDGHCKIVVLRKNVTSGWATETLFRDSLPTVFSHVLTTQEPIWNVHEDSDLAANLRKGYTKPEFYSGRQFTVVPIIKALNPVAALALTNYPEELFEDNLGHDELKLGIQLLQPMLAETIWSGSLSVSDEWYRVCVSASEAILASVDCESAQETASVLSKVASAVHRATGLSVFLSKVNPLSREMDVKAMAGFDSSVEAMYRDTRFYALAGNTQGPMPLAVNRGKVVVVGDLSWLYPVLHPFSLRILKASGCRSAAAVPILAAQGDASSRHQQGTWGLLWLESRTLGDFTPNKEPGLRILAAAIESVVSRTDYANRAHGALEELVRSDVADKLLQQVQVREEEIGYLIVADIRGSTKIANAAGAQAWLDFVSCMKGILESVAEKYGLRLQFIVWDAFYFTAKSDVQHERAISQLLNFADELNAVFRVAFERAFPESPLPTDGSRARFCVEYGDITRDVSNGSWAVTGAAMASVSKLEAACKGLAGWFFFTETLLGHSDRGCEILRARNPGTESRIVRSNRRVATESLSSELRAQIDESLKIFEQTHKKAA